MSENNIVVLHTYKQAVTVIQNMPNWAQETFKASDLEAHRALARAIIAVRVEANVCNTNGEYEGVPILNLLAERLSKVLLGYSYAQAFNWLEVASTTDAAISAVMEPVPPRSD